MSDYKLTFKLKQHTPLIHFQWYQKGATLRASEVKPKLDKFLIEKAFGGILNFESYKNFLLGDTKKIEEGFNSKASEKSKLEFLGTQSLAFDYKIKIVGAIEYSKKIEEGRHNQYGSFFGTIGEEYTKNPKGLSFTESEIDLKIKSFKEGLLEIIENNIVGFFEQNNFGTRQSKGFGSFTITKQVKENEQINFKFSNSGYKSFFTIRLTNGDWFEKYKSASDKITLLYKAIRSGINLKNRDRSDKFYFKSLMFLYAKKKYNSQWEKKTIKEHFFPTSRIITKEGRELYFPNRLDEQQENRPKSDPLHFSFKKEELFKDLLGLSSEESWYSYRSTIKKVQAKKQGKMWIAESKDNMQFERFKSPILFKPILIDESNLAVYLYLDQKSLDEAIKVNKDFIIKNGRNQFHLSFPVSFSLNDYFDFFLDKSNFDIGSYVEKRFQDQDEYNVLKQFFNELSNNKR